MRLQTLVKEYHEYGFENAQIAQDLGVDESFIKIALTQPDKARKNIPKQPMRAIPGNYHPGWELLFRRGPFKLNTEIRKMGYKQTAIKNGITSMQIQITLDYFRLEKNHDPFYPVDAIEKMPYVPISIQKAVDERDGLVCLRCGQDNIKKLRYVKIKHPGPVTADNYAKYCRYCRYAVLYNYMDDYTHLKAPEFIKKMEELYTDAKIFSRKTHKTFVKVEQERARVRRTPY
jgi:hypothetical protein